MKLRPFYCQKLFCFLFVLRNLYGDDSSGGSILGTGIFIEDSDNILIKNASIEGMTNGVVVKDSRNLRVDGLRTRSTENPASFIRVSDLEIKNVDISYLPPEASLSKELCEDIKVQIQDSQDFGDLQKKFGDRLKGRGIDLDRLLERMGNGSSVVALIFQIASAVLGKG